MAAARLYGANGVGSREGGSVQWAVEGMQKAEARILYDGKRWEVRAGFRCATASLRLRMIGVENSPAKTCFSSIFRLMKLEEIAFEAEKLPEE